MSDWFQERAEEIRANTGCSPVTKNRIAEELRAAHERGRREERDSINRPHIHNFFESAEREAAFQKEHWGKEHDEAKTDVDFLWVLSYLATKAAHGKRVDKPEKAHEKLLHRIITCAALCANWYAVRMEEK